MGRVSRSKLGWGGGCVTQGYPLPIDTDGQAKTTRKQGVCACACVHARACVTADP